MYFSQNLTAGQWYELQDAGDFFRIIASQAEDVDVVFYKGGREVARTDDVGAGYFERIAFDKVSIMSAAGGVVRAITRMGAQVGYDRAVGAVNISGTVQVAEQNVAAAFTQAQATVTNASAQLLAAKAGRRYLLIQNKDATGVLYVNLAGAAATAANGVQINPSGSLEITGFCPSGAIFAIGSIASNANIVTVEA